jgi:hypothetical protein
MALITLSALYQPQAELREKDEQDGHGERDENERRGTREYRA